MVQNKGKDYPLYKVVQFKDFKEMLSLAAERDGNKPAFKYFENDEIVEVTYKVFKKETEALGTALSSLGASDKHIAAIGENSYNWITVFLTALNSAGVFIPIDKELPAAEVGNILKNSDSEILFFSKLYEEKIHEIADSLENIKYFIGFDIEEDNGKFLSYKKLMKSGYKKLVDGDTSYTSIENDPEALKMLVYTSGTTGTSKGVMLSTKNLVSCVYYGLQVSTVYDVCLSVLPYHHTYESVCGILVSLHKSATICINENLRTVSKNLKVFKPTYIMLVPLFVESMYKKIWANAEATGKDKALKKAMKVSNSLLKVGIDMRHTIFKSIYDVFGGNIKKVVCGGAPIREELGHFFETVGITLINGYGITECSPLVSVNRDYFYDFASVGVRLPCIDIKIFEPNEDDEGEICVKGDTVMLGYYKRPDLTNDAIDADNWFHTGDYGKMDKKKRLYITGRKKNLIVLKNGKNVYPEEIEDYVSGIPLVSEVIVTAVKNDDGEETALRAEIYPDPEKIKDMTQEQALEAIKKEIVSLNSKLPNYKQISKVILRTEAFDKTTSGKIKRQYGKN